jgi:alpha-beta hydrolase superfamily lysophospholipase
VPGIIGGVRGLAHRLGVLLAAASVVAAVGTSAGAATRPPLQSTCGDTPGVETTPFYVRTSDGVDLYSIEVGGGPTAIVLVHESPPASLCGWTPYIPSLTAAGFRVLAFDLRGFSDSTLPTGAPARAYDRDLAAMVARARADGAKRVFLLGASYGGAVSVTYAPPLPVDGVISLSGETYLPSQRANPLVSAPRLKVPLLIVGSRHDHYLPVKSALALLRRTAAKDKRTAFYPGGWHGWDIVETAPYAANARTLIAAWIRARS